MADDTRIDRWLSAVRLVKTRPMATQLCDGGHVRVNGNPAKPSTRVRAGDVVHALIADRVRIVEVVRPIETRVGAPVATTCYVDNSPPPVRTSPGRCSRPSGACSRGPSRYCGFNGPACRRPSFTLRRRPPTVQRYSP